MSVALTGADGPVGASLAQALAQTRPVARIADADLASRLRAEAAFARASADAGPIEALVHAYVPQAALRAGSLVELDDADWDARCEAVIRATINTLQAVYGQLRDKGGTIIVVQPTIGLAGQRRFAAYAAACEAQRCLVKATARGWGRRGIRVHSVVASPELFGGELAELAPKTLALFQVSLRNRAADKLLQDLAATVAFLLSEGAAGLTGTTTAVDAGRWMPL